MTARRLLLPVLLTLITAASAAAPGGPPVFEKTLMPTGFPDRCWLPNLACADDGTLYCAFALDIKSIWVCASRDAGRSWGPAVKVLDCPREGDLADPNILCVGPRVTVFASFGPAPRPPFTSIETLASSSDDGGVTWSPARLVPIPRKYVCGKVHVPVRLDDGTLAMGYSYDVPAEEGRPVSDEPQMHLHAGALLSRDEGETWTAGGDIQVDIQNIGADEPALVKLADGSLFAIVRTFDTRPYETRSHDGGLTWDPPQPAVFAGHNSPSALLRLRDGAILRVWDDSPSRRFPLVASLSTDECQTWSVPRTITEPGTEEGAHRMDQASYPSIAQAPDGTIVVSWWETGPQGSNVGLARLDRAWVEEASTWPTVVAFGDSVTLGTRDGVPEQTTFRARLARALEAGGRPVRMVNAGVPSSTTRDGLARLEGDVLARHPALVTVMFGINDAAMVDGGPVARTEPRVPLAEYKANLTAMVERCRAAGAKVVLCTPTPMSRAYLYSDVGGYAAHEDINYLLADYAQAAREVAAGTGTPLVDTFALFTALPDGLGLIGDGNHPWPEGHRLIAEALQGAVREALVP
jgi:lysophospholipase L1-like esterase